MSDSVFSAAMQTAKKNQVLGPGFGVRFDVEAMGRDLDVIARKQLPFAMALSLNRTMEEGQSAVFDRMSYMSGLTIRTEQSRNWLMRQVKFFRGDRATKEKLEAILTINPGAGSGGEETGSFRGRSILAFLEQGGERVGLRPFGDGSVFGPSVVVPIRAWAFATVPKSLYPINLGLQPRRKIEGGLGKASLRGTRRTFVLKTGPDLGLVLQRTGKGKRDTRVLFFIKSKVSVKGRHFIIPTIEQTFRDRLPQNFEGFFRYALSTAKDANGNAPATAGQGVRGMTLGQARGFAP